MPSVKFSRSSFRSCPLSLSLFSWHSLSRKAIECNTIGHQSCAKLISLSLKCDAFGWLPHSATCRHTQRHAGTCSHMPRVSSWVYCAAHLMRFIVINEHRISRQVAGRVQSAYAVISANVKSQLTCPAQHNPANPFRSLVYVSQRFLYSSGRANRAHEVCLMQLSSKRGHFRYIRIT